MKLASPPPKYTLTEKGRLELEENEYVPYMHSTSKKTSEDTRFGLVFNVWSINKLLGTDDKHNWKSIVEEQEQKIDAEHERSNQLFMQDLQTTNPTEYNTLQAQNQQISIVQEAYAKYKKENNLNDYIAFWEHLWANGGLKFESSQWHFELPDLYIKCGRYDDALSFCEMLKVKKPKYADKAARYIERIQTKKLHLT